MASVRLTKALQETIERNVRTSFDEVLSGYEHSESVETAVKEHALAHLKRENAKYLSAAAELEQSVDRIAAEHGGVPDDTVSVHMSRVFKRPISTYDSYEVRCVDPESVDGEEAQIYYVSYPFNKVSDTGRCVLPWSKMRERAGRYTRDQELVDMILPTFLKKRSIERARDVAEDYANNMMRACNTLGQLLRKWPDAVNYVPDTYLADLNNTTTAKARPAPVTSDSIMNIDEAMKSIRLQAEAVKALKG